MGAQLDVVHWFSQQAYTATIAVATALVHMLVVISTEGCSGLGPYQGLQPWRTSSGISSPAVPLLGTRASSVAAESVKGIVWS